MGRPKAPLISRRKALEVALDIIDTKGIGALNVRYLAERLDVANASLYHHFTNKDEIVVGAAKLAFEEIQVPETIDGPWQDWLLENARRLRSVFRAHPDLVQVMLRRSPLGIGVKQLNATARLLTAEGAPVGAIVPMLEALERFTIGSALHEANATSTSPDADHSPDYALAFDRRTMEADEIYDMVCEQIVATAVARATAAP